MKIHNVNQGSEEWHALRARHHTSSSAAAMLGLVDHQTKRDELLRMKATGTGREFSEWEQRHLLDQGHALEALARPIVEEMLGEDLFPATATDDDDNLLASYDGLTMDEETAWEHKMWNEELVAHIREHNDLPDTHWPQCEQQLLVGAKRVIFTVSDGTPERMVHLEYRSRPERAARIVAGWKQFDEDLANYKPVEVLPPAAGATPMALPALIANVVGEVKSSNLAVYRSAVQEFVAQINTDLHTDEDFATAENTIKFCDAAEKELDTVKRQALAQMVSVDELVRTMDDLREQMRSKRLELDRLVKARKDAIRVEIATGARDAFTAHIEMLNERIGRRYMPPIATHFADAMKGKRTISSLRNAVNTELANRKIEANAIADRIQLNMKQLADQGEQYRFLFADEAQLVVKDADAVTAIAKQRVAEHEAKEQRRREQERERIRQEEEAKARAKAEAEARAKAQAEAEARAAADRAKARAEADAREKELAEARAKAAAEERAKVEAEQRERIAQQQGITSAPEAANVVTMPASRTTLQQVLSAAAPAAIAQAMRPTDDEIIDALCLHYRVHESKVIEWLLSMDLNAASKRLAATL